MATDTERLDWYERNRHRIRVSRAKGKAMKNGGYRRFLFPMKADGTPVEIKENGKAWRTKSLRSAIDAAMASEQS